MRLLPGISYGTQGYPEKVARSLQLVNIMAWAAAAFVAGFAAYDVLYPHLWRLATVNGAIVVGLATVPAWHRFGAVAAPIAFAVISFVAIYVVCSMLGTSSGMQTQYAAIVAALVIILGMDHILLSATFGVVAVALIIALQVTVPFDTGLLVGREQIISFACCVGGTCSILFAVVYYSVHQTAQAEAEAAREYNRSEALLVNILPVSVASRLKSDAPPVIADRFEQASVLFADMAGFTARASDMEPGDLVRFLNDVFTGFDRLVEKHGLEKIKTTGDCYMVVSGAPTPRRDHAEALAKFAFDLRDAAGNLRDPNGHNVPIRIGLASGPIVAGVVGARKFFYDVWGDVVNVASRMESTGLPGLIQVPETTYALLKQQFSLDYRGFVEVKGKGRMQTWFLVGRACPTENDTRPTI